MVIDTSALIAVLEDEPEASRFRELISADPVRLISAVTLVEASFVAFERRGEGELEQLHVALEKAAIEVVPFRIEHVAAAVDAFRHFGKGRHPASLNFGDCFSYALSRSTGEPLLFKGEDFSRTDVKPAA